MTREQAVKWVKFVHDVLCEDKDEEIREALRMAIKALKGADGDLISREDAIKNAHFQMIDDAGYEVVRVDDILALPSAEAVQRWIPVSERLPNIGDTFLVTVMVGTRIKTDVASNFGSYIDGFWDTFNDWIEDEECHVTAWMPLPEPYEGGDSE